MHKERSTPTDAEIMLVACRRATQPTFYDNAVHSERDEYFNFDFAVRQNALTATRSSYR